MISNSSIKAAWIAHLKANAAITALVSQNEIREVEWKGTDFIYPNIRVRLQAFFPNSANSDCRFFTSEAGILVFSEEKSSKQADDIAAVIAGEMWAHGFTSNGIMVSGAHLVNVEPAVVPEGDTNSWMSIVNFRSVVQAST